MAIYDVAATGLSVLIRSTITFPMGFFVQGFADDSDPIGFAEQSVAEADTNINGEVVTWGKPQLLNPTLTVVAGSPGDSNLSALLNARKRGIKEAVEMIVTYPDGGMVVASEGTITTGTVGRGVSSDGKLQARSYTFAFGTFKETRPVI